MTDTLSSQISSFEPVDGNWLPLETLFEEAFSKTNSNIYYPAIFTLFERYPEDDGCGVFWSAIHGMEKAGGYENDLVISFRRCPSELTRAMLIRIRNGGETQAAGVLIDTLIGPRPLSA